MDDPDRLSRILGAGGPHPQPDDTSGLWLLPAIIAGADIHAAAIARRERTEAALAIAEEALRGAIAAIDAAYDEPGDNGAYTVRERAALAKIEALKGGAAWRHAGHPPPSK